MKKIVFAVALVAAIVSCWWIIHDDMRVDREMVAEVLQIEKDLGLGIRPDRDTIDRLYRYRNGIDEKYGFPTASKAFREAYDRVIKPL